MISKEMFKCLTKEQIIDFFKLPMDVNHKKKANLVEQAIEILKENPLALKSLYNTFAKELAMSPYECEQLLGCTTTERRRWTKNGKLKVSEYQTINKYGRTITYPMYDRGCLEALSIETVNQWRAEHELEKEKIKMEARKKAKESRQQNEQLRARFANEWRKIVVSWYKNGDLALAASFELAYWTMWVSRWAKEHHRKSRNAIKHSHKYKERETLFYEMKKEAIKSLYQTSYAKLSFYRPEDPDKWDVTFCPAHFDEFKEWRRDCGYYLEVNSPVIPEYRFSFHIPYPIAQPFLPSSESLQLVNQDEQIDGLFRFGRNILTEEKIVYSEKEVINKWQEAYMKLNLFLEAEAKSGDVILNPF